MFSGKGDLNLWERVRDKNYEKVFKNFFVSWEVGKGVGVVVSLEKTGYLLTGGDWVCYRKPVGASHLRDYWQAGTKKNPPARTEGKFAESCEATRTFAVRQTENAKGNQAPFLIASR